jgi:hypothetical protein
MYEKSVGRRFGCMLHDSDGDDDDDDVADGDHGDGGHTDGGDGDSRGHGDDGDRDVHVDIFDGAVLSLLWLGLL